MYSKHKKKIDEVGECVKTCRRNIGTVMTSWYEEILPACSQCGCRSIIAKEDITPEEPMYCAQ